MLVCPQSWDIDLEKTSFSLRDFISFLNCFPYWATIFKKFAKPVATKIIRKEKLLKLAGINNVSLNLFSYFSQNWKENSEKRIKQGLLFQKKLNEIGFDVQKSKNNSFCYVSALTPKNLENKRDALVNKLQKRKIFCTRMWHTPLALNPLAQKEYNLDVKEFPNTIETANRIINFPLQNFYTENDIQKIINALNLILKEIRTQNSD
jgi:dTDP-4-amino-4,6-dideoxygalactose transaminase